MKNQALKPYRILSVCMNRHTLEALDRFCFEAGRRRSPVIERFVLEGLVEAMRDEK